MGLITQQAVRAASHTESKDKQLDQQYDLVVQALIAAFSERLKTVVLFGSYARGEARSDSDHDLLVVIETLPADPVIRQRTVRQALLPILDRFPDAISLIAKTPEEVALNLTPLLVDVCVDGICLYGASYFEPYRGLGIAALNQSDLKRQRVGGTLMWLAPSPSRDWELSWEGYFEGR